MSDAKLLQTIANRIAGLPVFECANDFPEPLRGLWNLLDKSEKMSADLAIWSTLDPAYMAIAADITALLPVWWQSGDNWRVFDLGDSFKPREPLEYVVDGVLVVPSLVIVFGVPGGLKSMLIQNCCLCVAGGIPWLTGDKMAGIAIKQGPVYWIDNDNGRRRMHERFEALARKLGIGAEAPLYYSSMPKPGLDASDPMAVTRLIGRIRHLKAKLVVIDNLITVSGGRDENSSEMGLVMEGLRRIVEEAGVCLIVIHHQRKGSNGTKEQTIDTIRGHSSIVGTIDLALLVERKVDSDEVTVRGAKIRDAAVDTFAGRWEYIWKSGTKELETAWFEGVAVEDERPKMPMDDAIVEILQTAGTCSQTKINGDLHVLGYKFRTRNLTEILDSLELLGRIFSGPKGPRGSKTYHV